MSYKLSAISVMSFVGSGIAGIRIQEQFINRHLSVDQALPVAVADDRLEIFPVRRTQAERPRIGAKKLSFFVPVIRKPGERNDSGIHDASIRNLFRLFESFC